jgi:hypothetical protein
MTHSIFPRILLATSIVLCAASVIYAQTARAAAQATETADDDRPLTTAEIMEVYKESELGMRLYGEKKYDEAFPHLMVAAVRGLKRPQAQVGVMHLHGLGPAKKDTRYAIGWLGVAADGLAHPPIEKYFKDIWKQIPEENVPAYESVINTFVARYGTKANNVNCKRVRRVGSKIREVRCMMTDPNGREVTDMMDEIGRGDGGGVSGFGNVPGGGGAGPGPIGGPGP